MIADEVEQLVGLVYGVQNDLTSLIDSSLSYAKSLFIENALANIGTAITIANRMLRELEGDRVDL